MAITQQSKWAARVARDTRFLRTDDSPLYRRIRALLQRKGVAVEQVIAAVVGPEDQDCEFGIIVTPDKQVYEYELSYRRTRVQEAEFSAWRDLTDTYQTRARREAVAAALDMVGRDRLAI